MDLVVDANIVISALIGKGRTLDLLFSERFRLFAPQYLFEEITKHKAEILEKSLLGEAQLDAFLSLVTLRISIVPKAEFEKMLAKDISPDPNDREYFALAMSLGCPIWTNDKKLKEQERVRIFNTTELIHADEK